jgi:hypothetical protein
MSACEAGPTGILTMDGIEKWRARRNQAMVETIGALDLEKQCKQNFSQG